MSDSPQDRNPEIWLLVVIYQGHEIITLHTDEDQAWDQLVDFVEGHTLNSDHLRTLPHIADEHARIGRFFASSDDFYAIIQADVSNLADALEALPQRQS